MPSVGTVPLVLLRRFESILQKHIDLGGTMRDITKTGEEEDVWKQRVQTHDHQDARALSELLERNYYGLNCVP